MPGTNQERRRSTKPGTSTRKPLPESKVLELLRNSNLGTSHGTNPEMRVTSINILDHQGSNTGTNTNPGITIEITLQAQEEQTEGAIVKKMTIGTSRRATILKNIVRRIETSPGSTEEVTTPVVDQGMIQDLGTGNHPEIDMGKEDRGKEVRALEDRGREVTALEVVGGEVMITGEVMLAMGAEVEKVAQRP